MGSQSSQQQTLRRDQGVGGSNPLSPTNLVSSARTIPLSKGYSAVIDTADYERVSKFVWSADVRYRKDGTIKNVYAVRADAPRRLHRFLAGVDDPKVQVDHQDHDGLNNRRLNLRVCENVGNSRNARKNYSRRSSEYKGVSWCEDRSMWVASIEVSGRKIHLGYFTPECNAALAYDKAARRHFGEFAVTNFWTIPSGNPIHEFVGGAL